MGVKAWEWKGGTLITVRVHSHLGVQTTNESWIFGASFEKYGIVQTKWWLADWTRFKLAIIEMW